MVTIKFLARFKDITGDRDVEIDYNGSISGLIDILCFKYDNQFKEAIFNKKGDLRDYMKILVNGEDIRTINGLKTGLNEGDQVVIFQTIAGG